MALPTTRVAVMGPAGKEFVYKQEIRDMRSTAKRRAQEAIDGGASKEQAEADAAAWMREQEALFSARYEKELMNPKEALSLGSISEIVMPTDVRASLAKSLNFYLSHYTPEAFGAVQREFH
jgi:acetyl-CoA carboxylase carboxyltransferase component